MLYPIAERFWKSLSPIIGQLYIILLKSISIANKYKLLAYTQLADKVASSFVSGPNVYVINTNTYMQTSMKVP